MTSLAEALPKEQARVRELRDVYVSLRGHPGVNVEFAIAQIDAALRYAEQSASSGDVVNMIQAYEALKGFKE